MSDDLLQELRELEREYPAQPIVAQRTDLEAINRLRARLGMRAVDARLHEIGAAPAATAPPPKAGYKPDHTAARGLNHAYLKKAEDLAPHQAYAERVARATTGPGQTPVRPLATLGTGGGPLLCDHCGKPIVLEGGSFHGVAADAAWARSGGRDWNSWILGGLVVEIQTNGTLRIYHGYPGRDRKQCCNAARRQDEEAQARFQSDRPPGAFNALLAFLADEFPDLSERARSDLANEALNIVHSYDPGVGVNRPDGAAG